MNLPDISTLLSIRAALSSILTFILLTGSIALFLDKRNGITKAMATVTMINALYVGVVVFVSFIDVVPLPTVRYVETAVWDVIHGLWILSFLWLAWKIWKEKH